MAGDLMERLTEWTGYEWIAKLEKLNGKRIGDRDVYNKLAAYEDTGLTPEEVKKLAVDHDLYKRAFEEVCRQFNFGDEKDYEDMRDAFLRIVGEVAE